MADAEIDNAEEQPVDDSTGITDTGLESGGEQSENQITQAGTDDANVFYDPTQLPDEMQGLYKEMQGAFTKKMQDFSSRKDDLELMDQFRANPQAVLQQVATQYGLTLNQGQGEEPGEFEPQTWDDVTKTVTEQVISQLQPLLGKVQELQKGNIEQHLDQNHPDWRVYEDKMMSLVNQHPTLADNPDLLYKLSVPDDVLQSRATQMALKKLQTNTDGAQVSSGSSTNKSVTTNPKVNNFNDAVKAAKAKLASQGMHRPTH